MNTPPASAIVRPETELTLTVTPLSAGAFVDEGISVLAHLAPERAPASNGSRYRVVLTVKNLGARTVGPFDVTARFDERGPRAHRVRTVTHSVAVLEPGASVRIKSLAVLGLRPVRPESPVKLGVAVAATTPQERVLAAAA
jgi:hypothetical protein